MRTWSVRGTAFALCTRSSSLSIRTRTSMAWKSSFGDGRTVLLEARPKPVVDLAEPADRDREVPARVADVRLAPGDALREPLPMSDRDHQILPALPEENGDADLVEVE